MAAEHGGGTGGKPRRRSGRGPRRKDVIIASKFWTSRIARTFKDGYPVFQREDKARQGSVSRRWIMQAVEESLTRLEDRLYRSVSGACRRSRNAARRNLACGSMMVGAPKGKGARARREAATFATADDLNTSQSSLPPLMA